MSPEETMHERIVSERARRVRIQFEVARRVDERVRMLDPAFRNCSHAEHVRRLVVWLGEIGAIGPGEWGVGPETLQEALVDLAADVQAWMESIARDAAQ